jgi:hypothetical protein
MKMKKKYLNENLNIIRLYMEGSNTSCSNNGCSGRNDVCTNYGNCRCS